MNRSTLLLISVLLLVSLSACRSRAAAEPATNTPEGVAASPQTTPGESQTPDAQSITPTPTPVALDAILAEQGDLTTASALIANAGSDILAGTEGITFFAPTDSAFATLPQSLLDDDAAMQALLAAHVINQPMRRADLAARTETIPSLHDEFSLSFTEEADTLYVNTIPLREADIPAGESVVHRIDALLLPPELAAMIQSLTVQAAAPPDNASLPTIPQIVAEHPELSTLYAGWEAAGLLDMLEGAGPFTIFAPTDTAFGDMVDAASEALLIQLDDHPGPVLLHHVAPVYAESGALQTDITLESLQGESLRVTHEAATDPLSNMLVIRDDGEMTATIVSADLRASNGVIHLLDAVLLPSSILSSTIALESEPASVP